MAKRQASRAVDCGGRTDDGTPCRRRIIRRPFKWHCTDHQLFGTNGPIAWYFKDRRARDEAVLAGSEPIQTRRDRYRVAADETTGDWPSEIRGRGRALIGAKRWDDFAASASLNACRFLANVANELEQIQDTVQEAAIQMTAQVVSKRSRLAHEVAAACVKKFADLKLGAIGSAADAIRVIGVYICVFHGRLRWCRCVKPLAKSHGPDFLRQTLRRALPDIGERAF